MGQGKSQARREDLTLRKNHHTPSQALGGGGGGCPSAPRSRGRNGVGVWGACWPHGLRGLTRASPSASCLFHPAFPCRPGDGRGPRALPFPSEEATEEWRVGKP